MRYAASAAAAAAAAAAPAAATAGADGGESEGEEAGTLSATAIVAAGAAGHGQPGKVWVGLLGGDQRVPAALAPVFSALLGELQRPPVLPTLRRNLEELSFFFGPCDDSDSSSSSSGDTNAELVLVFGFRDRGRGRAQRSGNSVAPAQTATTLRAVSQPATASQPASQPASSSQVKSSAIDVAGLYVSLQVLALERRLSAVAAAAAAAAAAAEAQNGTPQLARVSRVRVGIRTGSSRGGRDAGGGGSDAIIFAAQQ